MSFYSTVAQVIPVLFVVLAIEVKLLEEPRDERDAADLERTLFRLLLVVSLAASEALCLAALHDRKPPGDTTDSVIWATLGFAGIAVIGPYLQVRALGTHKVGRWLALALGIGFLVLVVLMAVGVVSFETLIAILVVAVIGSWIVSSFADDLRKWWRLRSERKRAEAAAKNDSDDSDDSDDDDSPSAPHRAESSAS